MDSLHTYFARIYTDRIVNRRQLEKHKNAIKFDRKRIVSPVHIFLTRYRIELVSTDAVVTLIIIVVETFSCPLKKTFSSFKKQFYNKIFGT